MTKPSDTLARLRARSIEAGRFVLPLEPVWADKLTDAYSALRRAELADEDERAERVAEAKAVVTELEASAGDNVAIFRFRRMSRAQYDTLISRHPPTAEQRKEDDDKPVGQRRMFDTETMAPDLLSVVCIDPSLSIEDATDLMQGVSEDGAPLMSKGEAEAMLNAALSAALSPPRGLPRELTLP